MIQNIHNLPVQGTICDTDRWYTTSEDLERNSDERKSVRAFPEKETTGMHDKSFWPKTQHFRSQTIDLLNCKRMHLACKFQIYQAGYRM